MPKGGHHPAVGADVVKLQPALLAIFQPLVADLIAAYLVVVDLGRDRAKVLSFVDVHAFLIGVIAKAVGFRTRNDHVPFTIKLASRPIEFRRLQ